MFPVPGEFRLLAFGWVPTSQPVPPTDSRWINWCSGSLFSVDAHTLQSCAQGNAESLVTYSSRPSGGGLVNLTSCWGTSAPAPTQACGVVCIGAANGLAAGAAGMAGMAVAGAAG